jgi:glycosyltransferase involved in cell wall biosynthesis
MKLSFIIIAYNEEKSITNALDSIYAQLDIPKPFEVIVVNDGSLDATFEIVQTYSFSHPEIKIVDLQLNQGRGAARAAGIKAAKGKYLALIDADIILPKNWLKSCMPYMSKFDACAGTAVPDGDVTWVYNTFNLVPKVIPHEATVTGSNGLYRSSVFSKVSFNQNKKNGEDIDLGFQMKANNLKSTIASDVIVEHHETKSYSSSLAWLYESGIGATKQLFEHKKIRMPDLVFVGFLGLIVGAILFNLYSSLSISLSLIVSFGVLAMYMTMVSALHLSRKFYLSKSPFCAVAAIISNASLHVAYCTGRLTGLFSLRPAKKDIEAEPKKVTVYFDYESNWGMPWRDEEYNLEATTNRLLDVLDKHNVKATFFVVGKIVEEQPKVIQSIAKRGHLIGLHGYEHESLDKYSSNELTVFGKQITKTEDKIKQLTGSKPISFRSPYLMGPLFHSDELYDILSKHGYQYVNNREIRYQQELFRPGRLSMSHWLDKDNRFTEALTILLNLRLIFTENIYNKKGVSKLIANCHWLLNGSLPFKRNELLEIPLYSPLDCDLLGLPKPNEQSSQKLINYTIDTLMGGLNKKGSLYSLNFHDWIIGTENRIEVLDEVLRRINNMPNTSIVTDDEALKQYIDIPLGSTI